MAKDLILKDVQPPLSQEETNYTVVSPQTGVQQCANCRFFLATNWSSYNDVPLGPACVLVSGYPEPILATGRCDKWELRKPFEPEPMEVEIVEGDDSDEEIVDVEVTETKAYKVYVAPKHLNAVQKLMRSSANSLQPGTTLVRKDNERYMLIISSNGFKDRHEEHVATLALKEYVEGFKAGTVKRNKHMYWHAIEVGEIIAAGMVNGFLVEIAKEKGVRGKKFYDYVEANSDIDWGASQGFWVRAKDIRTEGETKTYKHIDKDETSSLPRDAAANLFTLSAIGDGMAKTFEQLTDEIFGKGTAEALTKGTGQLKKHLLANGYEQKRKDAAAVSDAADAAAEAESEMPETEAAKDRLINRMVEGMAALLTEIQGALAATATVEQANDAVEEEVKSLKKALEDQQKAHEKDIAEIREKMKMAPRAASTDDSTRITDEEEAKKAKDRIAPKKTTSFGGLVIEDN